MKELTEYDQLLLGEKGIKVSKLQEQVAIFLAGIPPVNLVAPAHVGSGILKRFMEKEFQHLSDAELSIFVEILDLPDQEFLALVNQKETTDNPQFALLLDKIRRS